MRHTVPYQYSGIFLGMIFSALSACAMEGTSAEAVVFTVSCAHVAYTVDRILDDKLPFDDANPLTVLLALCTSTGIMFKHNLFLAIPIQIAVTPLYIPFKTWFPEYKPAYVAGAWMLAGIVIPSAIMHVKPDFFASLSMFSMTWAESNRMDVEDIEEDRACGIYTIPVKYGPEVCEKASNLMNVLSFSAALLSGPSPGHLALAVSGIAPLVSNRSRIRMSAASGVAHKIPALRQRYLRRYPQPCPSIRSSINARTCSNAPVCISGASSLRRARDGFGKTTGWSRGRQSALQASFRLF